MTARTCPNCEHPLSGIASYCVNCGTTVREQRPAVSDTGEGKSVPWRAIEAVGVFLLGILATLVVTALLAVFMSGDALLVTSVLVNEAAVLVVVLVWVRARYGLGLSALGVRDLTAENLGIGAVVGVTGIGLSIVVSTIVTSIIQSVTNRPVETPRQIPLDRAPTGAILLITGISVLVLAPIAEEIFFRGFLFRGLRRWARPSTAILVSSGVFAATHIIPLVIPSIFALGILLAVVVERRGSLVPSIVAHMTFNLFGFIFGFVLK